MHVNFIWWRQEVKTSKQWSRQELNLVGITTPQLFQLNESRAMMMPPQCLWRRWWPSASGKKDWSLREKGRHQQMMSPSEAAAVVVVCKENDQLSFALLMMVFKLGEGRVLTIVPNQLWLIQVLKDGRSLMDLG